jgi:hypothetical protein
MVTAVTLETDFVETVKSALVCPAGTSTVAGTVAAAVLLLESPTLAPPAGAGAVSVAVPWEEPPAVTALGLSVSEASAPLGGGAAALKARWTLMRP